MKGLFLLLFFLYFGETWAGESVEKCLNALENTANVNSNYRYIGGAIVESQSNGNFVIYSKRGSIAVTNGINCSRSELGKNIKSKIAEFISKANFAMCPSNNSSCSNNLNNRRVELNYTCRALGDEKINQALQSIGLTTRVDHMQKSYGPSSK